MKAPDKVQKTNYAYLLGYILIPLAVGALSVLIGRQFFQAGGVGAVVCFIGGPAIAILWWLFGGSMIYKLAKKKMLRQLDSAGIDRRQIFYSDSCVVSVDIRQGKIGLLFFWNPFGVQVVPASRVTRAWTDGAAAGIIRSTKRVSFLFEIDGITIRVNTFISNQRWRMNDDKVLEGISKADLWVQVLEQASWQEEGV